MDNPLVRLTSHDGKQFIVPISVAKMSKTLSIMLCGDSYAESRSVFTPHELMSELQPCDDIVAGNESKNPTPVGH